MNFKIVCKLTLILSFLLPLGAIGQINRGGTPILVQHLKSATSNADLVVMPSIDNQKLKKLYSRAGSDQLKPLRFAHSFEVSLTSKNSGMWYTSATVNVWQLRIRSVGAYSLNLILDQFKLPEKAKLFLISQSTGEVKGAYTSANNSDNRVLAIEPVEGEEILVQYEEPITVSFPGEFRIVKVSHDFVGITAGSHRPLGISGSCNVNVNCDVVNGTEDIRDAVCRVLVEGKELCTGTLVNNTSLDGSPYILTAYHCINTEAKANASVFLFNYESPYCASIDGDVSRSMSGSTLKASFDSLDFALVRLNALPPFNYRSYLSGWNRSTTAPSSSIAIHHPIGDIKKVAIDRNPVLTSSFESNGFKYKTNGFWQIQRWDVGVTESGSSGGPLFDSNKLLMGSLTGGWADCIRPEKDYFSKFSLAWDYRKEPNKQLKVWLDPLNSNTLKLEGKTPFSAKSLCKAVTNFKENDTHATIQITNGATTAGYWSGSNQVGITDFAEQFKFSKNCEVQGVTLGIAKVKLNPLFSSSFVELQVYSGKDKPETLLYSEKFDIKNFWIDGMNYLPFKNTVKTEGDFFVSCNISQLNQGDTLVVYMANRKADVTNSFYLKDQNGWKTYNALNSAGNGSALLTELIACNIDDPLNVDEFKTSLPEARFFPNPLNGSSLLTVQTTDIIDCEEEIAVYDLLGKKQNIPFNIVEQNQLCFDFTGKRPGIYVINLEAGGRLIVGKIAYVPSR